MTKKEISKIRTIRKKVSEYTVNNSYILPIAKVLATPKIQKVVKNTQIDVFSLIPDIIENIESAFSAFAFDEAKIEGIINDPDEEEETMLTWIDENAGSLKTKFFTVTDICELVEEELSFKIKMY